MITQEQYNAALEQKKSAETTISQFHQQKQEAFNKRASDGTPFTDSELVYAAFCWCSCGHGMAYPKNCGMRGQWSCSSVLKGVPENTPGTLHDGPFPFAFYEIKSEGQPSANGLTTRGGFRPKPATQE